MFVLVPWVAVRLGVGVLLFVDAFVVARLKGVLRLCLSLREARWALRLF